MNEAQIIEWLGALGVYAPESGAAWVQAPCPLAPWTHAKGIDKHPSFGVRVQPGLSLCKCFACDWTGDQAKLLFELKYRVKGFTHDIDFKKANDMIVDALQNIPTLVSTMLGQPAPEKKLVEFPQSLIEAMEPAYDWTTQIVHPYLEMRGVPYGVAESLNILWHDDWGRIVFPVRDNSTKLVGLHGRSVFNQDPKYLIYTYKGQSNLQIWYGEQWVDMDRPVVVAESVFDLARIYQVYRNVVSPLTASLSKTKVHRIAQAREIVTLFDADAAGEKARYRMQEWLPKSALIHLTPSPWKDPGDMPVPVVEELLGRYLDLDPIIN